MNRRKMCEELLPPLVLDEEASNLLHCNHQQHKRRLWSLACGFHAHRRQRLRDPKESKCRTRNLFLDHSLFHWIKSEMQGSSYEVGSASSMFGKVLYRCSATRIFQGAVLSMWSSAGSFCSRLLSVGHSGLAVVFSGEHMFGGGIIHSSDWLEYFIFNVGLF